MKKEKLDKLNWKLQKKKKNQYQLTQLNKVIATQQLKISLRIYYEKLELKYD